MCLGATVVAVLVGEERAEAPLFRVASAQAAAAVTADAPLIAPEHPSERRDEPRGRALKLHLASGNDSVHHNAWVYIPKGFDPNKKTVHLAIIFHGFKECRQRAYA